MMDLESVKVGVLGSGSFGTAIVKMLVRNVPTVHWCVRNEFVKGHLEARGHNPDYLTAVSFNRDSIAVTVNPQELFDKCDTIILAAPSIYLDSYLQNVTGDLSDKLLVSAIKGIVPSEKTIVAEYIKKKFGLGYKNQGVIAGPCHAEEVAMERLSYLTIATVDEDKQNHLKEIFSSDFIRVNVSTDILGNEYSAVLKNIYAIGAGIASGLGYGDNYTAVYVSNAVREMEKFLEAIYEAPRDVNESAYLGDLLVTAYSLFSRNRSLGNLIGKGYTVKSAIQSMNMVAEGYYAAEAIYEHAQRLEVEVPIIEAVYKILYREKNAEKEFEKLSKILN